MNRLGTKTLKSLYLVLALSALCSFAFADEEPKPGPCKQTIDSEYPDPDQNALRILLLDGHDDAGNMLSNEDDNNLCRLVAMDEHVMMTITILPTIIT